MRISRIFTKLPLQAGINITLSGQEAHYLSKVLRLTPKASIILFNGDGCEYTGEILNVSKKHIEILLQEQRTPTTESPLHTILGLGISRGERMDYAIQKSTELGISDIVPLFTERCEVKIQGERLLKRQSHWQQIAISSCEQSARTKVPTVHKPVALSDWFATLDCPIKLIFDHTQAQSLDKVEPSNNVALLIGPEGGFTEKEIFAAHSSGFQGIKLGPRVLRTETAPLAALTVLQYLWGDLL